MSANRELNDPDDPTQPSWGGQFKPVGTTNHYVDRPGGSSISKWRKVYQKDPDGDSLIYSWSFYKEPSSYSGSVSIKNSSSASSTVAIQSNASGKNIHMILEIHDNGSPNLYAYRRVIINVQ